jgi:hypothetical protein
MSNEKSALDAMLAQYEKNNAPRYEKKSEKVYDLKNYFNTFIKDGINAATKEIRILPSQDGSPFVEVHGHKVQIEGEWKTFACLKHQKGEACPFCEAREELLATGKESDKELAKKYNARKMYVVKVIDRENEEWGVKFWRFNHDYRKEGIFDKIHGLLTALKTNKDITNATSGRDLAISIQRNQNKIPVVTSIAALDATPLSEDAELTEKWLSDTRTWEDVYSVRTYDYLEIIVKGGVPVWDKDEKKFVDKEALKADSNSTLEEELTLGVENVKANLQVSTTIAPTETSVSTEDEEDDLPF